MKAIVNTRRTLDPYNRFRDASDPCSNKHQQNIESCEAWERKVITLAESQAAVLNVIRNAKGPITPKEVAFKLGVQLNTISGRVTELKEYGIVRPTNIVRDGSRAVELDND